MIFIKGGIMMLKLREERKEDKYFVCTARQDIGIHFYVSDEEGTPVPRGTLFIITNDGYLVRTCSIGSVIAEALGLQLDKEGRIMLEPKVEL